VVLDLPIEKLANHHERAGFSCGIESLDEYLQKQAGQDTRKRVAVVYVQLEDDAKTIAGYYTLSSTSVNAVDLPAELAKKLPKYPRVPATLIGRLAVDKRHQGMGLGERLLLDGLCRSYENSTRVASTVVIVDAENEQAVAFYQRYGYTVLPDQPSRLFILMTTIEKLYFRI
jgi:ribosomal protein S18 acetylase RimI-like enzyme